MQIFGMGDFDDVPALIPTTTTSEKTTVESAAMETVERFIDIEYPVKS